MRSPRPRPRRVSALVLALVLPLALSCVRAGSHPADIRQAAPAVDSATVALWHFDEATGVRCADAGPSRIEATAGYGTHVNYGRFGSALRVSQTSPQFDAGALIPGDAALEPANVTVLNCVLAPPIVRLALKSGKPAARILAAARLIS